MAVPIVYPLYAQPDYTELMYSLRSVDKHMPGNEVVIVGGKIPDWLTGVTWIKLADIKGRKQLSIKRKIIAALRLVDSFIFMNDDVYLLKPYQPTYNYSGDLKHIGESGARPLREQLTAMGKPTKNFDTHSPLVYDRRFIEIAEQFTADTVIKSMFCNALGIEGIERPDTKINAAWTADQVRRFMVGKADVSTGPQGVKAVMPVLQELFSEPSKYEIV